MPESTDLLRLKVVTAPPYAGTESILEVCAGGHPEAPHSVSAAPGATVFSDRGSIDEREVVYWGLCPDCPAVGRLTRH